MTVLGPRIKQPLRGGGGRRGEVILAGEFTLGSSGALASAAGFLPITTTAGTFGVIKTATKTGRYSLVFDRGYRTFRPLYVGIVGPTDAAFGNTNANASGFRNRVSGGGATLSSVDIQLMLASTGADTDGASGYIVTWVVIAEEL